MDVSWLQLPRDARVSLLNKLVHAHAHAHAHTTTSNENRRGGISGSGPALIMDENSDNVSGIFDRYKICLFFSVSEQFIFFF
jgi:hypothetical protein